MSELPPSHRPTRRVSLAEKALAVGQIVGINAYHVNRCSLKRRFSEMEYQIQETPHFWLCTRSAAPTTLIVHWFAPQQIDADIGPSLLEELKPLGILQHGKDFADLFGAVVGSLFPHDIEQALRLFTMNTLHKYHTILTRPPCATPSCLGVTNTELFGSLYGRVCATCIGASLLDAGCSSGFLPLVVAERLPQLTRIVGVDIRSQPFPLARTIAQERQMTTVQFVEADLMNDLSALGDFDTVTCIHVLEHFTEKDSYTVLAHLLHVTRHRLILAVPFEQEAEAAYEHVQVFSRAKLAAVGNWCLEQMGQGSMWDEECAGGLPIPDRLGSF